MREINLMHKHYWEQQAILMTFLCLRLYTTPIIYQISHLNLFALNHFLSATFCFWLYSQPDRMVFHSNRNISFSNSVKARGKFLSNLFQFQSVSKLLPPIIIMFKYNLWYSIRFFLVASIVVEIESIYWWIIHRHTVVILKPFMVTSLTVEYIVCFLKLPIHFLAKVAIKSGIFLPVNQTQIFLPYWIQSFHFLSSLFRFAL